MQKTTPTLKGVVLERVPTTETNELSTETCMPLGLGMAIRVRVPGTRRVPDPTGTGMGTIFHPRVAPIPDPT
jgi:hypothetical protein